MANHVLFESDHHRNLLIEDFGSGSMVQANQHLIIDKGRAMILDPGGHKIYSKVLSQTTSEVGTGKLEYIFLSHQDPDIVAAINGWLMTTDATAIAPSLWMRFIPHFGLDDLVASRLRPIDDDGCIMTLGGSELMILPAHFLHSCGNFQVYDATSKILYSGDLGASIGIDYLEVADFDAHIPKMQGFHQRYMTSNAAMRAWARMVESLEIEIIAPQHGAYFRGTMVKRFIDWCASLQCGLDLMSDVYQLPTRRATPS